MVMALKSVDLKLLPVLQALLKHQSVTGASRALGLSPSAVSESLARLRALLNDSLLVRVGARMQLTSRANELIGPLEELCASIDQFFQRSAFDPQISKRNFVIATSDALAYSFAPEMLRVVRRHAPGISFHFVEVPRDLTNRMSERQIDFAFLPAFALADLAPAPLKFRQLDRRNRVILMSCEHPLAAKDTLSKVDVESYQHVAFSPDAVMVGAHSTFALELPEGAPLDVAVRTPFMTVIPHMLVGSDLLAIVGRSFANDLAAQLPLTVRPMDFELEAASLGMVWSPVYDGDLAHQWLRTEVADEVEQELARHWPPVAVT
jgi:DNA-binding transcriptional LysR family regulator